MRISSGHLKGRQFDAPKGHRTHPMSERIRNAMFNTLGDVSGLTILDAYGGSGAITFEAISRGASSAVVIEKDKNAYKTLQRNVEQLGLSDRVKAIRANCASWSDNNPEAEFDIIFADPPFDQLNLSTVSTLTRHLKPNGLMVLSHSGREATPTVNGVVVVDNRIYGDAALSYYRKESAG